MDSSAPTETEPESMCRAVTIGTAWHWPWVILTDGERMVVFSMLRAASAERNCDFFDRTDDEDVESGFKSDADADGNAADDEGKWEAKLEGNALKERRELGTDEACARFPVDCLREETMSVSSSTSTNSLGQSL